MMRIRRVYVAGPMTGLPQENWPAFMYAKKRLEEAWFQVEVPEPCPLPTREQTYRKVLPEDIAKLARCDAAILLPGYEDSNGVCFELHFCSLAGIPSVSVPKWVTVGNHSTLTDEIVMDEIIARLREMNQEASCPEC